MLLCDCVRIAICELGVQAIKDGQGEALYLVVLEDAKVSVDTLLCKADSLFDFAFLSIDLAIYATDVS